MIPLEGRVLPGLDEFMLRLGHLTVLSQACYQSRASWKRIEREAAELLTALIPVTGERMESVANYVYRKHLAPVIGSQSDKQEIDFRYPDLRVDAAGQRLEAKNGASPAVWWQDWCLSAPVVRSRVGAVSATGRAGSKTGLSHVCDWCMMLDLITPGGDLTHIGRLILRLDGLLGLPQDTNPYRLGIERLVFAVAFLREDFDVFSRFSRKLLEVNAPIKKGVGRKLFTETISEIATEAERARHLTSHRQFKLFQQMRELEKAAMKARKPIGGTSTAWHRTASRLETYVDLGFLDKGVQDDNEKYEYTYYPTKALERAVRSFDGATGANDWIERCVVSVLFDGECSDSVIDEDQLRNLLPPIIEALDLPTRVLPIDVIAQGLAWLRVKEDRPISLAAARVSIEDFAKQRPELARLSRGSSGDRAEFVSIESLVPRNHR